MDMKINSKLVVQYRNRKAWSQQQLAEICDVSLRTIQRAENTANVSHETAKALACAFEMDVVNILLLSDEAIEKNTSRAIFIKVGLASSTFLGLITSVFIFTPLTSTSANETTISSKGSQTFYETDMTERVYR